MNKSNSLVIQHTQKWVQQVIVGYNFCPFAYKEIERDRVRYIVAPDLEIEQSLMALLDECDYLDSNPETETTLLIFPQQLAEFDDFLDFVDLTNALLIDRGYEGVYQLATFHPRYCFADNSPDDATNYTNRSPYPMLHIIREASLERALASFPDPENIPGRNIQRAGETGATTLQALLDQCMTDNNSELEG